MAERERSQQSPFGRSQSPESIASSDFEGTDEDVLTSQVQKLLSDIQIMHNSCDGSLTEESLEELIEVDEETDETRKVKSIICVA